MVFKNRGEGFPVLTKGLVFLMATACSFTVATKVFSKGQNQLSTSEWKENER